MIAKIGSYVNKFKKEKQTKRICCICNMNTHIYRKYADFTFQGQVQYEIYICVYNSCFVVTCYASYTTIEIHMECFGYDMLLFVNGSELIRS